MHVTLELETHSDTDAEELSWMLNLLRFEMSQWSSHWKGRVRRVQFLPHPPQVVVTPRAEACPDLSLEEILTLSPSPGEVAQG